MEHTTGVRISPSRMHLLDQRLLDTADTRFASARERFCHLSSLAVCRLPWQASQRVLDRHQGHIRDELCRYRWKICRPASVDSSYTKIYTGTKTIHGQTCCNTIKIKFTRIAVLHTPSTFHFIIYIIYQIKSHKVLLKSRSFPRISASKKGHKNTLKIEIAICATNGGMPITLCASVRSRKAVLFIGVLSWGKQDLIQRRRVVCSLQLELCSDVLLRRETKVRMRNVNKLTLWVW